jgi:solute carrier family 35, member F5
MAASASSSSSVASMLSLVSSGGSYALGLVFIFIVAIIWALASILVQYLYNDTSFDAPFLLTYIGTSLFTVLLPIHWLYERCCVAEDGLWYHYNCCCSHSHHPHHHHQSHHEWERIRSSSDDDDEEEDCDDDNNNDGAGGGGTLVEEISAGEENNTLHDTNIRDRYHENNHLDEQEAHRDYHGRHNPHRHESSGHGHGHTHGRDHGNHHKWTNRDHIVAAAKIAPMWFISNFAYNASLRYTSITSSTVLVNTGSLFTFLFAVLMRDEYFNWWKVIGVACGISGSILTGLHDWDGNNNNSDDDELINNSTTTTATIGGFLRLLSVTKTSFSDHNNNSDNGGDDDDSSLIWGDILSVISAVFYGVYAVMVRVLCPHDESLMSMQLFLGYVGLWNMVVLSPIAIWHITGDNVSSLTLWILECLVMKGLFDNVLSDYLWARAVVLTSATVATVGLGLTIPLAFVSDVFLGRADVLNFQSVTGAVAVLTGFVLVNMGQRKEEEEVEEANHPMYDAGAIRQHPPTTRTENTPLGFPSSSLSGTQQELPQVGVNSLVPGAHIHPHADATSTTNHQPNIVHHMSLDYDDSASGGYKDQIEGEGAT